MVTLCVVCLRREDFLVLFAAAPRCLFDALTVAEDFVLPYRPDTWWRLFAALPLPL
jgi:hypothetical protein